MFPYHFHLIFGDMMTSLGHRYLCSGANAGSHSFVLCPSLVAPQGFSPLTDQPVQTSLPVVFLVHPSALYPKLRLNTRKFTPVLTAQYYHKSRPVTIDEFQLATVEPPEFTVKTFEMWTNLINFFRRIVVVSCRYCHVVLKDEDVVAHATQPGLCKKMTLTDLTEYRDECKTTGGGCSGGLKY